MHFTTPEVGKVVVRLQHPRTTSFRKSRTPKKAAHACHFCFNPRGNTFQIACRFWSQSMIARPGPGELDCSLNVWGSFMKKLALLATALAMFSNSAMAADMAV